MGMGVESGSPGTVSAGRGSRRDLPRISGWRQAVTRPRRRGPPHPPPTPGPKPLLRVREDSAGQRRVSVLVRVPVPDRRGRTWPRLNPETRLPHLHPQSPTSAPGSGVRKSASSRAPLRTGSGRSASTSNIRSAAGSSWRRLRGSPSQLPGLGVPPPAGCMPCGPPGGGGAGAHPLPRLVPAEAPGRVGSATQWRALLTAPGPRIT